MDDDLVGYLMDALEPDERRKVETYLRAHADARKRLARLRQLLQPLESNLPPDEPPPDLWVRTLATVAEYQCRQLPVAPPVARAPMAPPGRGWWRRADVLVAASLLLCLLALVPKGLNSFRAFQNREACKNNLRALHVALMGYTDRHNGAFPNIADRRYGPHNVAGMVVPILHDDGVLQDKVSVTCPSNGRRLWTPISLQELLDMDDDEFARRAPSLLGCYAYSLGYYDETGEVQGINLQWCPCAQARLPIMADKPPADVAEGGLGNSPNHGGSGQNVLYVDGHCDFQTRRTVGVTDTDDIYVNADHRVAPGMGPGDAVLGSSATRPR